HASGITVTIDAATLATGAGELPVKVSGTVDAAYAGKAFDIPITVLGQQLYVRVNVGCGAYTTAMANRTIVKGTPKPNGDSDWLQFQCFNLGADATLSNPFQYLIGEYYQWGQNDSDWLDGRYGADDAWGDGNAWGDSWGSAPKNPNKGNDDPCPTGWKVPSITQWELLFDLYDSGDMSKAKNNTWKPAGTFAEGKYGGYMIGGGLFLPAAGIRKDVNGSENVGSAGYYWSSIVWDSNSSAGSMSFTVNDGSNFSSSYGPEDNGLQLRCVKCADGETCN
ncbi:hypothetical protein D0T84_21090, partial [Dysgonomonas sp. 521]|uniref:FISUMP domain-containing protein n=1 Tax=Dysgonomonas sp. 521 TaxID=2302932 RepID=UPI001C87D014